MIVEFGHFSLILCLVLGLLQAFSGFWAAQKSDLRTASITNALSLSSFVAITFAFFALIYAHVSSDFTVKNVVANSHSLKPMIYKIAGTWGNHEGSMLLWALIAAGFGLALYRNSNGLSWSLRARALAIQGLIVSLVCAYVVFASNPFERVEDIILQGKDLNPLLQDPALALHPPFLYLGYVGLSLVFSLAVAALLEGRVDAAWARIVRPWVLSSWVFLTIGIGLGAYWAYYELGWGGWWFWDPVENASFMPWLLASALLHSAIVTEKRGALAAWTVLLAILAFSLSLLGTFLVRSGVLTSVHAFALDPERGVFILMILLFFTGGGLLIYGLKGASMGSDRGVFALVSRETALILNNLFLVVSSFTILIGTLYPLVGEALYGRALSVGAPYFNAVFTPLMSALLVFLPISTFLSWKRSKLNSNLAKLIPAIAFSIIAGLVIAFAAKNKPMSAVGIAIGFWLISGAFSEIASRIGFGKIDLKSVVARFDGLRPSHIGMFLSHFGLGIFVIGAVVQQSFTKETTIALAVGETAVFENYQIALKSINAEEGPNFTADRAIIGFKSAQSEFELSPQRRYYQFAKMPTTEVSRKSVMLSEFYVALGEPSFIGGKAKWTLRLYKNPFISWVFGGVFIMALGGIYSLSDRRLKIGAPKPKIDKEVKT